MAVRRVEQRNLSKHKKAPPPKTIAATVRRYWMVLATEENALLAFEPTRRIVPTTNTKITASITAYSAISWPVSSVQNLGARSVMGIPFKTKNHLAQQTAATCKRWPGAMFDTPANASSVILTFVRFAARVYVETRSCVSRLRVPSVRGGK